MDLNEAQSIYGKIKILYIDDDELQLETIKLTLENMNHDIMVETESNHIDAMEKIKLYDYDCILLDYILPILDGVEVAKKIRQFSNIPIILYTSRGGEEIVEKSFQSSINDYLRKEIYEGHYNILEKKIINLVDKYRNNRLYEEILGSIDDSIIIINKDYNIVFHNEVFKNLTKEIDIIGKSLLEFIEDDYKEDVKNLLKNDKINSTDSIILDLDGFSHHVEMNKFKIKNYDHDNLLIKIKDVTEYVSNRTMLNSSESRFSAIAEMSPDAIATLNVFGYITYVNKAFCDLSGYSEEEIVGKHMIRIPTMRNRDLGPYIQLVKNVFSGKLSTTSIEFPFTRKDGSSGISEGFIRVIKFDGKREFISILKDVTSRKMKEEEYQNIFKSSPEGIIHFDLEGKIKDINDSGLYLLNVKKDEFIGQNVLDEEIRFIEKLNLMDIFDEIKLNNKIDPFEIEVFKSENIKWLDVSFSLIKVKEEKLGIQMLVRNITDKKEIEKERQLYTDNLEKMVEERTNQIMDNEKMVTLAKVSSMIAHDLKGPLQVINNALHLIKYKPDDQELYIEYIKNAVNQANELIEEMRIHKETPLKLEYVNISNIIEESLIQVKVSERVKFETIIKTETQIEIDRSKFIRVLNNLFKNSIEAMPDGGKVTVIVEEERSNISIKVIDTGLGIPEEKLDNLFRPFQSTKEKGLGLGLTYCKNTVESHGGNIYVESELGKGTKFIITIPKDGKNINENYHDNIMEVKDSLIE